MTPKKRFFIGGGGALMPVLVSFLAIDIGAAISNETNLTTANIIGIGIRYVILFVVGGVVAYLHEDEHKPFKLFELGIAAPALITSLITAQGVGVSPSTPSDSQASNSISIIGNSHAGSLDAPEKIILAGGFLNDVFKGISGGVYRDVGKSFDKAATDTEKTIEKTAQDTGKAIEKTANETEKTSGNNQDGNNEDLVKARVEAAKLRAEAARARAEALEKEYRAAQVEAAEAQALAAEKEAILLEKPAQ